MGKNPKTKSDFGYPRRSRKRNNIVGIFDLAGFTSLESNEDLVQAVRTLETQIEFVFDSDYWRDERQRGGALEYVVAFSQNEDNLKALNLLTRLHSKIRSSGFRPLRSEQRGR